MFSRISRRPGVRLLVESEAQSTVIEVEIDHRHAAADLLRKQPSEVGGNRRRTDAAANARHRNELARAAANVGALGAGPYRIDRSPQQIPRHRLRQIVGDAELHQIAKQADVVVLAENDDLDAGFAGLGERVDVRQRQFRIRNVDDHQPR